MAASTDRASPARSRIGISFPAVFRNFRVGTVSINVSMPDSRIYAARHHAPHRLEALFHMQSLARA